ncbi:MAG: hypothetical protein DWQ34_25345 [Planctomycetota bacterium]|nr:MAG: hypothetical protein DWQ29_13260 [Planctomycetota bacterium]REJ87287.1 MAG: hypothetical protein DWQ34_25345 [Planctomycetota bacterium]REK27890.1 MAG: hypothetical protein DWQ41_07250 [Planctomycetota bacterium]REK32799.1 MAG: hypothetical protein DWQ45_16440 [Planctomycetota bacterium]
MPRRLTSLAVVLACVWLISLQAGMALAQERCGLCQSISSDSWLSRIWEEESCLRSVSPCEDWTYSLGVEIRHRYMDERGRLRPPGPGRSRYQLWRVRPFAEITYRDWVTGYVEAIDASSFGEDLPVLPIDVNRDDLLQYYLDVNLWSNDAHSMRLRYGRQLLKYGSQHLVSPLGWANTMRNFEGAKLYYRGGDWSIDGFLMQSVNAAAGGQFRPFSFDTPDQSRWFNGIYATYAGLPNSVVDVYWLWLREAEPRADRIDGNRHTIGARWAPTVSIREGEQTVRTWFADVESAYQFGTDSFGAADDQDVSAGFFSAIVGHTWNALPWSPTVQGVFWWGSGDDDPTDGTNHTVSTLYPLGHAYWGQIDNFAGQNLLDYSIQGSIKPRKDITLSAAWHRFDKDESADFIYNIGGAPLGPSGTDKNLGHELDLVATFQPCERLGFQAGYFWFWYGEAVTQTALARPDAHQFYFQSTLSY